MPPTQPPPIVGQTSPLSVTCAYCGTHFTRPWYEVTCHWRDGFRRMTLRWADCSKCGQPMVQFEQATHERAQEHTGFVWKKTPPETIWPKPKQIDLDPLTGLLRKAMFEAAFPMWIAGAKRTSAQVSLVLLDLDNFKAINSGPRGLQAGDEILGAVGPLIKTTTKAKGTAYRWGGEEFVVVLPDFDTEEATAYAQRLRKALQAQPLGTPPQTLTASVGVATFPAHGTTLEALFEAADDAVKRAKAAGKNRVEIAVPTGLPEAPAESPDQI